MWLFMALHAQHVNDGLPAMAAGVAHPFTTLPRLEFEVGCQIPAWMCAAHSVGVLR